MNWQREVIHFRMFDHDIVHPDPMGCATLQLSKLFNYPYECKLDLKRDLKFPGEKVKGSIMVRIQIEDPYPFNKNKKKRLPADIVSKIKYKKKYGFY